MVCDFVQSPAWLHCLPFASPAAPRVADVSADRPLRASLLPPPGVSFILFIPTWRTEHAHVHVRLVLTRREPEPDMPESGSPRLWEEEVPGRGAGEVPGWQRIASVDECARAPVCCHCCCDGRTRGGDRHTALRSSYVLIISHLCWFGGWSGSCTSRGLCARDCRTLPCRVVPSPRCAATVDARS